MTQQKAEVISSNENGKPLHLININHNAQISLEIQLDAKIAQKFQTTSILKTVQIGNHNGRYTIHIYHGHYGQVTKPLTYVLMSSKTW